MCPVMLFEMLAERNSCARNITQNWIGFCTGAELSGKDSHKVYTNLQPAGRFGGQAAAANSRAAI